MAAPLEDATHEEQRAVIRFLAAEGVKPSEVYRRMSAQYGSSCLNQSNVYKWMERFKERRTSIKAWNGSTHLLQWKKSSSQVALQEK